MWGKNGQYIGDEYLPRKERWSDRKKNPDRKYVETTNIHPNFKLDDKERKKLFETLLQQVPVQGSYMNQEDNTPQLRHKTFSLLYYVYNWGYPQFVKHVKGVKNNYRDGETERIREFEHIFSYLARKGKMDEIKEIMDEVLSWDMDKKEKKSTKDYIQMAGSWSDFGTEGRKQYEKEILPQYDISPYETTNSW